MSEEAENSPELEESKVFPSQEDAKEEFAQGRYHIKQEFSRGGMGVIYKVFEKNLQRHLAMKVLLEREDDSDEQKKRSLDYFLEEALITAQLEHPNIVPVHDMGEMPGGNPYFTMKMVQGEPLSEVIHKLIEGEESYQSRYSLIKRLMIFRKVCDAVAFAHYHKILHRDIKPENIMVGDYGEVLLMDWGLAKYIGDGTETTSGKQKITSLRVREDFSKTCDEILGTPLYISPEQLHDEGVDEQSDIYLLGGTLYHLITYAAPHYGSTMQEVIDCCVKGKVLPPEEVNPSSQIPNELSQIVMKALSLNKEHRYLHVTDLAADLDAFISGEISVNPLKFQEGETIIRQGEEGSEAYFIISGKVDVYQKRNNKDLHLATIEQGSVVGEMAIISAQKRSASVVASEETQVLIINRQRLQEVFQKLPPWIVSIISSLVNRLQIADKNIHPLMFGNANYHILHQLTLHLLSLSAFQPKYETIEDLDMSFIQMIQQISSALCIPVDKIQPVMEKLLRSELFQETQQGFFRITSFPLLGEILSVLHEENNIDTALPFPTLLKVSNQQKESARAIVASLQENAPSHTASVRREYTLKRKLKDFFRI